MASVDASRGTVPWAFNRFREDALTNLLHDLADCEHHGFDETVCTHVRKALEIVVNEASSIPDGTFLGKPLWRELELMKVAYVRWNDVKGVDEQAQLARNSILSDIRHRRHRVARRIRKNQLVLANDLDLKAIEGMLQALAALPKAVPEVFKHLGKAIVRYGERKKDTDAA